MKPQIDDYDLNILTLLETNGRLTHQELSDLVGLSASPCSRRRINPEQDGLILGYHARQSRGIIGLIEVRLTNHTPDNVDSFQRKVAETLAIIDAYKTTGNADYLLKVMVADLASLSTLISQLMAGHQHPSVAHIKTSVVLTRLKENGVITPSYAGHPSGCRCVGCTSAAKLLI